MMLDLLYIVIIVYSKYLTEEDSNILSTPKKSKKKMQTINCFIRKKADVTFNWVGASVTSRVGLSHQKDSNMVTLQKNL
jgi:hypothetical protein